MRRERLPKIAHPSNHVRPASVGAFVLRQWRNTLDTYAKPVLGDLGVAMVETAR